MEPVWDGKAFQPRLMLPLSLTWDHRVIDGAAAARFNAYFSARSSATSAAFFFKEWQDGNLIDIQVPDIGDFDEVAVIELLVKPRRHRQGRAKPDHRGVRQGLHGDSLVARRRGERAQGQAG